MEISINRSFRFLHSYGVICQIAIAIDYTEYLRRFRDQGIYPIEIEGHPDNITASAFGGLTLCYKKGNGWKWVKWEVPSGLDVLIIVPPFPLSTREARQALPSNLPREDAIFNLSHASLLALSLVTGKWDLLKEAMDDRIHQPYRFPLIPPVEKIFNILRDDKDVTGISLSGAGPSLLVFCLSEKREKLREKIRKLLSGEEYNYQLLSLRIEKSGLQATLI